MGVFGRKLSWYEVTTLTKFVPLKYLHFTANIIVKRIYMYMTCQRMTSKVSIFRFSYALILIAPFAT